MSTTTDRAAHARPQLRSEVALAGRMLPPAWPLETFIAVNPLGGLEHLPFAKAIAEAGDLFGARGTLDESAFRAAHAGGRITEGDLLQALARLHPESVAGPPLDAGGRLLDPAVVLLADLLHGDPSPTPVRERRTLAEQHAPEVAAMVDAQTTKWCAAYTDEGHAAWSMPDRDRGFYTAWRMLAPRDRSLASSVRRRLRLLPDRPEDAALRALAELGIGEPGRRRYLQAHLSAVPGWAAHILWRSEHGGGIDLVELLAMRLAYEAALLADHPLGAASAVEGSPSAPIPTSEERAATALSALGLEPAVWLPAAARVLERVPVAARSAVWLDAYEAHYRDPCSNASRSRHRPRRPTARRRRSCSASTSGRRGSAVISRPRGRTRRWASRASSPSRSASAPSPAAARRPSARCCSSRGTRSSNAVSRAPSISPPGDSRASGRSRAPTSPSPRRRTTSSGRSRSPRPSAGAPARRRWRRPPWPVRTARSGSGSETPRPRRLRRPSRWRTASRPTSAPCSPRRL